ncbi:MAG: HugZ family protein [Gammaproteobacteria bacterium]
MSTDSAAAAARHLMLACYDGVLATVSHAVDGYPFGSVVPYCLDRLGRPVILIASIAQHTRNITHDARVSLTIFDRREADLQDAGRVTYLGDARRIDDESERKAASSRYFRYFPEARGYDLTHDFAFYVIVPRRLRFIGGFGDINWFEPGQAETPNPFDSSAERGIVEHMNQDHADAVLRYCELNGIPVPEQAKPALVGCDGEGIHIRLERRIHRVAFPHPVANLTAVRQVLISMLRAEQADG